MANNTWVKYKEVDTGEGEFEIQPLTKGMGVTLGNSLRRVLLSSLAGYAITSIKVKGASHEFSTIPNVVEDLIEIICNLKGVVFKKTTDQETVAEIKLNSKKKVTAKDIKCPAGLEVLNKDQYLFEITDKADVEIQIVVEKGVGYKAASEDSDSDGSDIEQIRTDSSFSPIVSVNHAVESIRVGRELDHELLKLTVKTDASISPEDAMKEAVGIFDEHLQLFAKINEEPEVDASKEDSIEDMKYQNILNMTVDELELSARSSNCLKRAGIETVSQLLEKDLSELVQIKNFGKKSADEINGKLKQYNLAISGSEDE